MSQFKDEDDEDLPTAFLFNGSDSDEEGSGAGNSDNNDVITLKYDTYTRSILGGVGCGLNTLTLALVSKHHSLWAEFVYNAARVIADRIDDERINCRGMKCLELGAGAGLPGLMAAIRGASEVVISDYGTDFDYSLVYAMDKNIQWLLERTSASTVPSIGDQVPPSANLPVPAPVRSESTSTPTSSPITVTQRLYGVGYVWGYPVLPLLDCENNYQPCAAIADIDCSSDFASYVQSKKQFRIETNNIGNYSTTCSQDAVANSNDGKQSPDLDALKFDVILLADLIFNRSEHNKLLWTVKECLKPNSGVCYVTYSHHDPGKKALDLNFFTLAESPAYGFTVTRVAEEERQSYPFVEQDGLDAQRGVVYLCTLQLL